MASGLVGDSGLGSRVWGSEFGIKGLLGLRVEGLGLRVQDLESGCGV